MWLYWTLMALLLVSAQAENVIKLKVGDSRTVSLGSKWQNVCVTEGQRSKTLLEAIAPQHAFLQTTIDIQADAKRAFFPYFSFRGRPTDDFHSNVGLLIQQSLFNEDPDIAESVDRSSILRDLLSSCPSPLDFKIPTDPNDFAVHGSGKGVAVMGKGDADICRMTFSSMGTACVSLPARAGGGGNEQSKVTLHVSQRINVNFVYYLIFFFGLLYAGSTFSEYKSFQYVAGSVVFTCAGLLLVVIYADKFFKPKGVLGKAKERSAFFLLSSSTIYATSFIYFILSTLRRLLVDYWEIVAIYVVGMSLLGALFTRFMRSRDDSKHFFRVGTKWGMRGAAVIAGYDAFPSPLTSMLFLSSLAAAYCVYWCAKFLGKSSKTRR